MLARICSHSDADNSGASIKLIISRAISSLLTGYLSAEAISAIFHLTLVVLTPITVKAPSRGGGVSGENH